MPKSLAIVKAKKENAFSQIQMVYEMTKKISDKDIQQKFLVQAKSANRLRQEFADVLDTYHELELESDPNYKPSYAPLNSADEMVNYIMATLSMLESKIAAKSKTADPPSSTLKVVPKLPKLEISDFDGTPEKWPVFYQLYNKLIHENESLSDLEKVTYLVNHLQGSARSICTGVLPTAENYTTLYESLVKRYDDKRQLASAYLTKILEFKPCTHESEKSINLFLEHFAESVAALKHLNLANLTDFMFVHIALKKLDAETSRQFEMTFRKEEMPSFDKLVEFLREQSKILGRSKRSNTAPVKTNNNSPKSTHAFVAQNPIRNNYKDSNYPTKSHTSNNNSCILCRNVKHQLYSCPVFHKQSVDERWSTVKKCNACFNCLTMNSHRLADCESKKFCSTCNGRHHSLLHRPPKQQNNPINSAPKPVKLENSSSEKSHDFNSVSALNTDNTKSNSTLCSSSFSNSTPSSVVLLSTALVKVCDAKGNPHLLRALIDNGSQYMYSNLYIVCTHLYIVCTPNLCRLLQKIRYQRNSFTFCCKGIRIGNY